MTKPCVQREILIRAQRETVFAFFTDPERFARWWGEGSTIEGVAGGKFTVRYPTGDTASGEVVEIFAPERIVLTWGYDDPGKPIGPGGSRVTITLQTADEGTRLQLLHEVDTEELRDMHEPGWRYHLAVFAQVATNDQHGAIQDVVDDYFRAWNEGDPDARLQALVRCLDPVGSFADAYGVTTGPRELSAHIAAIHQHMPGTRLEARGPARQSQGVAVADWAIVADDQERGRGTNVFVLAPDGRIVQAVGIPAS